MSPEKARAEVIQAALRCVQAEVWLHLKRADASAEYEYASEQLATAARELARATEALPAGQVPVGLWAKGQTFPIHARYAYPGNGWEGDSNAAADALKPGAVYTIESLTVGQSTSYLTFREVEGKFSTVLFAPVMDGGE